ncbi:50S ribosomal protein L11 methyltransferase [Anaerostipes sp.]|uniref:50S ribosomal protein L11 methyltransferase n=1 Tax=Anaerostipes sp. TaxID=1872530 RepID=UPI0025C131FE|nr:50S ribosomal protein L11 methyltransferase [Anaerostipes sp.]MBS7009428.1 50S ribosomal protein L11 methyltransferase [Anaerostipes sp.]
MGWNRITISTVTEAEDMLSYELTELGACGVEVEDRVPLTEEEIKEMFIEVLPDHQEPDDGKALLHCYFDESENLEDVTIKIEEMLHRVKSFMDIGEGSIEYGFTKEEDWINNWKQFFKPLRLDDTIIIKPTWEELTEQKEGDVVVEIDPGTAFGTGSHETTRLCIEGLKEEISPDTVMLDVGCGSGILSIIALKLGAKKTVMTDIDPRAVKAAAENMEVNHLEKDRYEVLGGNVLDDTEFAKSLGEHRYDVVAANILADVILPLTEIAGTFLKEDGSFVISGIINTKEQEVLDKLEKYGFHPVKTRRLKEWVSITAKKRKE